MKIGKYCFPGGHVEKDEEIKEAMIRETKEEIGVDIKKENLKLVHVLNRKTENNVYIDFIFECRKWIGKEKLIEIDKADKIKWFKINNIPENIIPFMKKIFENKKIYISYGWKEV